MTTGGREPKRCRTQTLSARAPVTRSPVTGSLEVGAETLCRRFSPLSYQRARAATGAESEVGAPGLRGAGGGCLLPTEGRRRRRGRRGPSFGIPFGEEPMEPVEPKAPPARSERLRVCVRWRAFRRLDSSRWRSGGDRMASGQVHVSVSRPAFTFTAKGSHRVRAGDRFRGLGPDEGAVSLTTEGAAIPSQLRWLIGLGDFGSPGTWPSGAPTATEHRGHPLRSVTAQTRRTDSPPQTRALGAAHSQRRVDARGARARRAPGRPARARQRPEQRRRSSFSVKQAQPGERSSLCRRGAPKTWQKIQSTA